MSLTFQMNSTACRVKSVNNRAEKHGDDDVIGQDVDVALMLPVDVLSMFVVDEHDPPNWKTFMYDDKGTPRALLVKPFTSTHEFEDHIATLSYLISGARTRQRFPDVKIKKWTWSPVADWKLEVSFQIQIHPDNAGVMGWLVNMLAIGEANVKIEPPRQGDMLDGSNQSPAGGDSPEGE